jgi:hypothetical protein
VTAGFANHGRPLLSGGGPVKPSDDPEEIEAGFGSANDQEVQCDGVAIGAGHVKHCHGCFSRAACARHFQSRTANNRAAIDIVGVQSHRRDHAGDDATFDVVSGEPIPVAA